MPDWLNSLAEPWQVVAGFLAVLRALAASGHVVQYKRESGAESEARLRVGRGGLRAAPGVPARRGGAAQAGRGAATAGRGLAH